MPQCSRRIFLGSGGSAVIGATAYGTLSTAGCAPKPASALGRVRLSFIVKTPNSDYWQDCLAGGKAAARQFGIDALQFTGPSSEADIAGQISIVEDAVAKRPDVIVLAPTAAQALVPTIEKAYGAGIKIVLIDSAANTNAYQTFLATNNYVAGVLAARTLAAAIQRKTGSASGQIAYSTFLSGVGSLTLRDHGFRDGIKAYPGLSIVAHRDAAGNQSTIPISIVSDVLTRFPALAGYFADSLITLQGAVTAFRENGTAKSRVSLVGFDSSPLLIEALRNGSVDGLVLQDPYQMGYGGIAYGILSAAGLITPKTIDTGSYVATPANLDTPEMRGLLEPATRRHLGFAAVG
jgi:ribose transport system substrate-binding protein